MTKKYISNGIITEQFVAQIRVIAKHAAKEYLLTNGDFIQLVKKCNYIDKEIAILQQQIKKEMEVKNEKSPAQRSS